MRYQGLSEYSKPQKPPLQLSQASKSSLSIVLRLLLFFASVCLLIVSLICAVMTLMAVQNASGSDGILPMMIGGGFAVVSGIGGIRILSLAFGKYKAD